MPVPDTTASPTSLAPAAPSFTAATAIQRMIAFGFDLALLHGAAKFLSEWISISFLRLLLSPSDHPVSKLKVVSTQTFQNAFSYANYYLYLPTLLFLSFVYYLVFLHLWGASFGKGLIGIAVVDRLGHLPSTEQIVKRYFATLFNSLTCGFLFIVGISSRRRLCLQDEVSATFVIKRPFHFALVRRAVAVPADTSLQSKASVQPLLLPLLPNPTSQVNVENGSSESAKPDAA